MNGYSTPPAADASTAWIESIAENEIPAMLVIPGMVTADFHSLAAVALVKPHKVNTAVAVVVAAPVQEVCHPPDYRVIPVNFTLGCSQNRTCHSRVIRLLSSSCETNTTPVSENSPILLIKRLQNLTTATPPT